MINWVGTAKQVASDVLARLGTAVTLTATYVDDPNDVTSDLPLVSHRPLPLRYYNAIMVTPRYVGRGWTRTPTPIPLVVQNN